MCRWHKTDEKRDLDRKDKQRLPSYFLRVTKGFNAPVEIALSVLRRGHFDRFGGHGMDRYKEHRYKEQWPLSLSK